MRLTIHQPEHMPWLGFFHKIVAVDVYVALDNVQYRHKYFQNRNKIRGSSGAQWLSVPVLRKDRRLQLIKDVEINNTEKRWGQKNWISLYLNYKKTPFFYKYSDYFKEVYCAQWNLLVDLNLDVIKNCIRFLGAKTKIMRASELGIQATGEQLILDICNTLNAEVYISGMSGIAGRGKDYENEFSKHHIEVIYDEFHHPIYKQLHEPFIPCMSIIDLLFNYGDKSLDIINGVGVPILENVFL